MLKEIKYVVYLLTIFLSILFVVKHYLSENNIKRSNRIIHQYKNQLDKKFENLPIIKTDTNDIVEYTNEIEKFKNTKQRIFWDLLKTNEK